jgi:hypothetical protein
VLRWVCLGDERLAILEPPLSTGAEGGSPVASPGMVHRLCKRWEWGPDDAKSQTTSLCGWCADLTSAAGVRMRPSRAFFALISRHNDRQGPRAQARTPCSSSQSPEAAACGGFGVRATRGLSPVGQVRLESMGCARCRPSPSEQVRGQAPALSSWRSHASHGCAGAERGAVGEARGEGTRAAPMHRL